MKDRERTDQDLFETANIPVYSDLQTIWPIWADPQATPGVDDHRIAFLFSDFDEPYPGMGYDLYTTEPGFRRAIDRCARLLALLIDKPLKDILWPKEGEPSLMDKPCYAHPALFSLKYALTDLWYDRGIIPEAVAGYGLGEYVAACVAGVVSLRDALYLLALRGQTLTELATDYWTMEIKATVGKVKPFLTQHGLTYQRTCKRTLVAGSKAQLKALAKELDTADIMTLKPRPVVPPSTLLGEDATAKSYALMKKVTFNPPRIPIISPLTGQPLGLELASPDYWVHHMAWPVYFDPAVDALHYEDYRIFVEIGSRPRLSRAGRELVEAANHIWLPSLREHEPETALFRRNLDALFKTGVPVSLPAFEIIGY